MLDTKFYNPSSKIWQALHQTPIITPLNSLLYNTQNSNLAVHGIHPRYQHLVVSLPLLLGPALYLLIRHLSGQSLRIPQVSAASGILLLSCIPHQEPRFLLPVVPLFLASVQLPRPKIEARVWLAIWIVFNTALGILMGIFHQGGVIPAQIWLGEEQRLTADMSQVYWWRTYSPPVWLLDHKPLETIDLMGMPFLKMQEEITSALGPTCDPQKSIGLVVPSSSVEVDTWSASKTHGLLAHGIWRYRNHLNLDDIDIPEEGIIGTLTRVVGRRGLVIWRVQRECGGHGGTQLTSDW